MSEDEQLLSSLVAAEQARLRAELAALAFLIREVSKLRRALLELQTYLAGEIHLPHLEGAVCGLWLGVRQVRVMDRWLAARGDAPIMHDQLRQLILDCTALWGIEETTAPHAALRQRLATRLGPIERTTTALLALLRSERRLLQRQINEESAPER